MADRVSGVRGRIRRAVARRRATDSRNGSKTPAPYGMVDTFSRREIIGWLAVTPEAPPARITVHLNGKQIAKTFPADVIELNNWGEVRQFRIALHDVWGFCGKKDKLSVRANGRILPIHEVGMFFSPWRNGARTPAQLQARLAGGELFDQRGRLALSKQLDHQWQASVLATYRQMSEVVRQKFGYDCFLVYGTLLGAVRENGFIGHDPDFDAAYVSTLTGARPATRELQQIAFALVEAGFDVEVRGTALHVHSTDDPDIKIDLFHLYFDESGTLRFPFGVAGTTTIDRNSWQGVTEIDFAGGRAHVPGDAEAMVEHLYGTNWRVPNPGFTWERDRTQRDFDGIVPFDWREQVYWENLYRKLGYVPASPFAVALMNRDDLPRTILDIGCGDGRDSVAFAGAGPFVTGLDRSATGIETASARAAAHGVESRTRFRTVDVADATQLRAALEEGRLADGDGPVLFYLRFLLHAVSEKVEDSMMGVVRAGSRPGDLIAVEFRTAGDERLPKAHGKHFRRYLDGSAFSAALVDRYGYEIIEQEEGTGIAPYGEEDPEIYRVLARRTA